MPAVQSSLHYKWWGGLLKKHTQYKTKRQCTFCEKKNYGQPTWLHCPFTAACPDSPTGASPPPPPSALAHLRSSLSVSMLDCGGLFNSITSRANSLASRNATKLVAFSRANNDSGSPIRGWTGRPALPPASPHLSPPPPCHKVLPRSICWQA